MIRSIKLENFRSHKKTKLNFSNGINTIVGSSGRGKTQILRAFYWAIENKPDGLSYVSRFNRDEKGFPVEPTRVTIDIDGTLIIRERTKTFNGYKLKTKDGKEEEFKALNGSVPEKISAVFNMSSVNIQKQLDSAFLLSGSAGEAARFLNSVIRLDVIDEVLRKARSNKDEISSEKKEKENNIAKLEKKIKSLEFVDEAKSLYERAKSFDEKRKELNLKKENLVSIKIELKQLNDANKKTKKILSAETIVNEIDDLCEKKKNVESKRKNLNSIKNELEKTEKDILLSVDQEASEIIKKIDALVEVLEKTKKKRKTLLSICEQKESYDEFLRKNGKYIETKTKELMEIIPDECPTCHQPIDKETFLEEE